MCNVYLPNVAGVFGWGSNTPPKDRQTSALPIEIKRPVDRTCHCFTRNGATKTECLGCPMCTRWDPSTMLRMLIIKAIVY